MLTTILFFIVKRVYLGLSSLPDYILNMCLRTFEIVARLLLHTPVFHNLRTNLDHSFPNLSKKEKEKIAHNHLRAVKQFAFDFIKSLKANEKYMKDKVEFKNLEILDELFQTTPFVVCFSGHLLDYEMLINLPLFRSEFAMCNIYQSTDTNDVFEKWICEERCKYGAFAVPSTSSYRYFMNIKKQLEAGTAKYKGYIMGVLGDTDPGKNNKLTVPFLNGYLDVYTGAERIGRKLNAAYVYANIYHKGNGKYVVTLNKLDILENSPFIYTKLYFERLESNILNQPENWFLWNSNRFRL